MTPPNAHRPLSLYDSFSVILAVIAVGATVLMTPSIKDGAISSASIGQGLKSDIAILHIDAEDPAFHFSASETFAKQGDRDLRR